jgi:hypothetical protein
MNWRYAIGPTKNFFGSAKDFVHNAGYSTTNHHFMCVIGRIMTSNKDTIMFIYYIEDQTDCGFPHVMFSEGKRKFIDDFMQRAFSTMQFGRKIETTPGKAISKPTTVQRTSEKPLTQTQEKRLTYIPKGAKDAKIATITLRSTPKPVWESDIERMIGKYNFFIKYKNETGYFPNDFVDNGDGTVTDRVTGLMWENGGSSSVLRYRKAKQLVSRLNAENYLGHDDWRIPTFEELCSLLESNQNQKRQYIDAFFKSKQTTCWSADYREYQHFPVYEYYIVDFSSGRVSTGCSHPTRLDDSFFLRAVRTIK